MEFEPLLQKHAAVVVIGVQNDYCDSEGILIKKWKLDNTPIVEMATKLVDFLDEARFLKIPIYWVQLSEDSKQMPKNFQLKMESIGGGSLDMTVPGSWGAQWYRVSPKKGEKVFECPNYDAFTNDKFLDTLKKEKIETLVITGTYTSRSVDTTVRSASTKGYNVFVPVELVAMPKQMENEHYAALTIMNMLFAYVISENFILDVWKGETPKPMSKTNAFFKRIKGIR